MATTQELKQRVAAFAYKMAVEELGEIDDSNALSWLDAVESRAVEIADLLAAEVVRQKAALRPAKPDESTCPGCGQLGRYQGQRDRPLLTRRGPTTITEPRYHCPCCRKDFFPDDPSDQR
jgi:hypothetical protein